MIKIKRDDGTYSNLISIEEFQKEDPSRFEMVERQDDGTQVFQLKRFNVKLRVVDMKRSS